jgi:predicted nucleotidyltransferase
MFDKENILSVLQKDKLLLKSFCLSRIGLFGSVSRRQYKNGSDIDFLLEYQPGRKTFDNFIKVVDYLEASFGGEIDVVTKESVSSFIYNEIQKDINYVQISD